MMTVASILHHGGAFSHASQRVLHAPQRVSHGPRRTVARSRPLVFRPPPGLDTRSAAIGTDSTTTGVASTTTGKSASALPPAALDMQEGHPEKWASVRSDGWRNCFSAETSAASREKIQIMFTETFRKKCAMLPL